MLEQTVRMSSEKLSWNYSKNINNVFTWIYKDLKTYDMKII